MPARNYQSIGDVLVSLKTEFPDITISKIRFLESEGLITPERTGSGYRKFYEHDVDRLRAILRLQRDEYLPLKVIRDRLDEVEATEPAELDEEGFPVPEILVEDDKLEDLPESVKGLKMSLDEMSRATGVLPEEINELVAFGILTTHGSGDDEHFDGDAYQLLTIAKDFLTHGVGGRHLQMYQRFADREGELFGSMVAPLVRQKNPEARQKAADTLQDLSRASWKIGQALLRMRLKSYLEP